MVPLGFNWSGDGLTENMVRLFQDILRIKWIVDDTLIYDETIKT